MFDSLGLFARCQRDAGFLINELWSAVASSVDAIRQRRLSMKQQHFSKVISPQEYGDTSLLQAWYAKKGWKSERSGERYLKWNETWTYDGAAVHRLNAMEQAFQSTRRAIAGQWIRSSVNRHTYSNWGEPGIIHWESWKRYLQRQLSRLKEHLGTPNWRCAGQWWFLEELMGKDQIHLDVGCWMGVRDAPDINQHCGRSCSESCSWNYGVKARDCQHV